MKRIYTLHLRMVENGVCIANIGSRQTAPQSTDAFSRTLEQFGNDPLMVAARRKELEQNRVLHLTEIELDEADLRLLGFPAV
jgi:hypothetical protein